MLDSFLDNSLRDVPVPSELLARLRAIPSDELRNMSDESLDDWLRGAAPSGDLLDRCRRIAKIPQRRAPLRQWAVAASLMLLIGLSYASSMAAFLLSTHTAVPSENPLFAAGEMLPPDDHVVDAVDLAGFSLEAIPPTTNVFEPLDPQTMTVYAADDKPAAEETAWPENTVSSLLAAADQRLQAVGSRFPRQGFIDGAMNAGAPLHPAPPRGRGAEPPSLAAYRLWQQSTGVHAEVVPAAAAGLETSSVPLDIDTTSFFAAQRAVRQGELPAPSSIRVEDFLAAWDYGFTVPSDQLVAIRTAAGPSPFGGEGTQLLQVAVHAPALKPVPRHAVWLTIVVDGSGSMLRDDVAESVRLALANLVHRLQPDDRLSLVAYHSGAQLLADHCTAANSSAWKMACERWRPDADSDMLAGLQSAYAVADTGPGDEEPSPEIVRSRRVVWISDGGPALNQQVLARLESALSAAARDGVQLAAINVGPAASPDPQMARCAQAAGGQFHRANGTAQIGSALLAALSGQLQTVAGDASLTVTFDPRVVAMYRLLGHESRSHLGEWLPARAPSNILAGQTSTALYELRLWPNQRDAVAEARLRWRDPRDGASRETVRTVRRTDFAPTFKDSAPSLQGAALTAEVAELFRHSYFAESGSARSVLEVAREASPAVRDNPAWRDIAELLDKAQRIKPPKPKLRPAFE